MVPYHDDAASLHRNPVAPPPHPRRNPATTGDTMVSNGAPGAQTPQTQTQAQVQPCRYKTGKTLGAGSYSVVKECVHIDTGRYYAAKVINKRLMAGREHMVSLVLSDEGR